MYRKVGFRKEDVWIQIALGAAERLNPLLAQVKRGSPRYKATFSG